MTLHPKSTVLVHHADLARRSLMIALVLGGVPGLGAAQPAEAIEALRPRFAYDAAADFALQEKSVETRGDTIRREISFSAGPRDNSEPVAAYLVAPRDRPVRAGILWVHWLGEPATTNRTEFLAEAEALASRGVLSLLIDAMWAKPYWYRNRVLADDYARSVGQVIALRRSLDLLQRQPGMADRPIAIVGHDYGGMYATIAAGIDQRAKTCVFIACTPSLLDWAFFVRQPASMEAYLAENRALELCDYLPMIQHATLLFQFAEHDKYVTLAGAQKFFAAAPPSKQLAIYGGADHSMTKPAAIREDRTAWLIRELGLN